MSAQLEIRNGDLATLRKVLETGRTRRLDVIVPATEFRSVNGNIVIDASAQSLTADGVTQAGGTYVPTGAFDDGVADKLGVDLRYMRKLRQAGRIDLVDANINGWLHGTGNRMELADSGPAFPPDPRNFMLRLYRADGDQPGVARALLSDKFGIIDNYDILIAAMQGISQAGVNVVPDVCDLTDRRMYVRFRSPDVAVLAPKLLEGYRNPFGPGQGPAGVDWDAGGWSIPRALQAAAGEGMGYRPGEEPVVFAGFGIKNSEIGMGGFDLFPELRVRICKNGLTLKAVLHRIHIGARQDAGLISWSQATVDAELELIKNQAADAIRTFLTPEWLARAVAEREAQAGIPVTGNPRKVIEEVVQASSSLPKAAIDDLFGLFTRGGQMTAGGVMQAATAYAQTVGNADAAYDIQAEADKILALAAKAAQA